MQTNAEIARVRLWLGVFMAGLIASGVTAFPLAGELRWLDGLLHAGWLKPLAESVHLLAWIDHVAMGVAATDAQFPFLAYGTDWLAFGHLVIALAFVGPYIDPVRNKWVITFGLIACAGVLPLALIAGPLRGIPVGWRLVDCSFGVFGSIPLWICRKEIRRLESSQSALAGTAC